MGTGENVSSSQSRPGKPLPNKDRTDYQTVPEPEKLLRAKDVASILQVSRSNAYLLMKRGEIPTIRVGRAVRVRSSDLEEFIKQSREP